jgi:ABC-type sugar transport system ATPase subunit
MAGLIPATAEEGGRDPPVALLKLSNRLGGVTALAAGSGRIAPGSVHALVGENGAGKSTLSRICAGIMPADDGQVIVDGEVASFRSPRDALAKGIATIAQELALAPRLTVEQNVFLGAEPHRFGFLSKRGLRARFEELAADTGFGLSPRDIVGRLRTADQQKVEIMRALGRGASMIIMDEPSAALSRADTEKLHATIRSLSASGKTVLLISHFLSEVLSLADSVTILRDGKLVRTRPAHEEDQASLIEAMLGRTLGSVFPDRPAPPLRSASPAWSVVGSTSPKVHDVSVEVRPGEILGIAGLVGAGRTEFARSVVGAPAMTAGEMHVGGEPLRIRSSRQALREGIVLIPESRKEQGLLSGRPIVDNVTLANLDTYSRGGFVSRTRERHAVQGVLDRVTVKVPSLSQPISSLSGGNQQKTLFARALLCRPRVLIADEPTRGVDVGSRRAIYELVVEQAQSGVGIIIISSDIEELLGLAHRIVVMRAGRVVAELTGEDMTEERVLKAAFAERTREADDG